MPRLSKRDTDEFKAYLRNCTDAQVLGVIEKEHAAGRRAYENLARDEQMNRIVAGTWKGER